MSATDVTRHLLIAGQVQGVGYRASTVAQARHLGLRGWVRNLADGRVEALFDGNAAAVEGMVTWCRRGPPGARVLGMEVVADDGTDDGGPDFAVRGDG